MLNALKNTKPKDEEACNSVIEGMIRLYTTKLLPLETAYKFHDFHSPALDKADFESKPMVLLIGQYSTGKTTFIRYLIGQDFPGSRIGPEPTTDCFVAVMNDTRDGTIPGNALVIDPKKQFRAMSKFGNSFLNRFQCSHCSNPVLGRISFVDTPGILSGEKQRVDRGYDFRGVIEWFSERVDRIILLFDAYKLDISDEFRRVIECLKPNEDKIRIVLNKADLVDSQQLMRVYGALMWNLGKILNTPEVARVFIGSFWDRPLTFDTNRQLFELEKLDLFKDLTSLPANTTLRKVNDLIRRSHLALIHARIIAHLKKSMPTIFGADAKKKELIASLPSIYQTIACELNISANDFPNVTRMQECLQHQDFKSFNSLNMKLIGAVENMLKNDMARLIQMIPQERSAILSSPESEITGGAFEAVGTPFGWNAGEGFDKGRYGKEWIIKEYIQEYNQIFESLNPFDGKLSGNAAREYMIKSKLPNGELSKIWKLSDIDRDGHLDAEEFALVCYLLKLSLENFSLPTQLPAHLIPPSKRNLIVGAVQNGDAST